MHCTLLVGPNAPHAIVTGFFLIIRTLHRQGYRFRTNCDTHEDVLMNDCIDRLNAKRECFLPWHNYRRQEADPENGYYVVSNWDHPKELLERCRQAHRSWDHLTVPTHQCLIRMAYTLQGPRLKTPSRFLVCWSRPQDGCSGLEFAQRLATGLEMLQFNLANTDDQLAFTAVLKRRSNRNLLCNS